MRFMLLLYGDEEIRKTMTPESWQEAAAAHMDFTRRLQEAGALVDSAPLDQSTTARSVRFRNRKAQVIDGPFAETKEVLGGYYLIDAASLEEAVAWAESFAVPTDGTIEVRPILRIPGST